MEAANLGSMIKIASNDVFIKKLPIEIQPGLEAEANRDLCTVEDYTARFYMPSPACISRQLRERLVGSRLVKPEHFVNFSAS